MALERHNPAEEFDTIFRRHLKQGGVPVAPCVGFDADAASAYLEHALAAQALTRFEAHLAGCAACRRYVIELARLNNEVESLNVKPPVVVTEPVWSRWYGVVAQWFDFSAWNRGWAAAATAGGLLLAVLATDMWQRMNRPADTALLAAKAVSATPEPVVVVSSAGQSLADTAAVEMKAEGTQSPLYTQPAQTDLVALVPDKQPGHQVAVPPPVTHQPLLPTLDRSLMTSVPQPGKTLALEINPTSFGTQPLPPPPPGAAAPVNISSANRSLMLPIAFGSRQTAREASRISLQPSPTDKQDMVSALVLPEPRPASGAAAKSPASEKPASDPVAAARNRSLRSALNRGHAFGFMSLQDDRARTKEADAEAKEQLKPLMQRLNGHTFFFDHGFWIDEEYKSDLTLPLVRLTKGNALYQQTLIENPTLEQFFQLGQVIVVWKGKIYEVRK